jgi:catechol 2,3-dioxygenase-like lactoylglutathione lyase family enzyme
MAEARQERKTLMRIVVSSIFVDDQDKALAFYTTKLGFIKKTEVPVGSARWLTVVAPDDQNGTELLLEPDSHPAVGPFKSALIQDGIPFASFAVDNVQAEYDRLRADGVVFTQPPVQMGPVTTAVLDDTCGNLIQLAQKD